MGNLLIAGLVVAWIVVLGPSVFRRSDERGPISLDAARDRLAAIHLGRRGDHQGQRMPSRVIIADSMNGGELRRPTQANPIARPGLAGRQQRRRAQILQVLLGSCALSFVLAVGTSVVSLWLLHLGVDAILLAYVAMLRHAKTRGLREGRRRVRDSHVRDSHVRDSHVRDTHVRDVRDVRAQSVRPSTARLAPAPLVLAFDSDGGSTRAHPRPSKSRVPGSPDTEFRQAVNG